MNSTFLFRCANASNYIDSINKNTLAAFLALKRIISEWYLHPSSNCSQTILPSTPHSWSTTLKCCSGHFRTIVGLEMAAKAREFVLHRAIARLLGTDRSKDAYIPPRFTCTLIENE